MSLQNQLDSIRNLPRRGSAGNPGGGTSAPIHDENMVDVSFSLNAAGDNVIIPPPGKRMEIMELFIWNGSGQQSLILKDGTTTKLPLTGYPVGGLMFGMAGNDKPHWTIAAGNPLVLNLSVGTLVEGYVKYRLIN